MEIVGTLVLMAPAAIVFLVLYLKARSEADGAGEAQAEPTEAGPTAGL